MLLRTIEAATGVLFLLGCQRYVTHKDMQELQLRISTSQRETQESIANLERVVANQECTANLLEIIKDIHSTCEDKRSTHESGHCDPEQLGNRITKFQSRLGTSFIREISVLRHAVFYLAEGKENLLKEREDQLEALTSIPRLPTTWYVIMTSPKLGDAEAERRVQWTQRHLVEHHRVSAKAFLRPWILDVFVKVKPGDLLFVDRPIKGSIEPQDLQRGVWVIRLSCLPYSPETSND